MGHLITVETTDTKGDAFYGIGIVLVGATIAAVHFTTWDLGWPAFIFIG
jgi:hypothetical protein